MVIKQFFERGDIEIPIGSGTKLKYHMDNFAIKSSQTEMNEDALEQLKEVLDWDEEIPKLYKQQKVEMFDEDMYHVLGVYEGHDSNRFALLYNNYTDNYCKPHFKAFAWTVGHDKYNVIDQDRIVHFSSRSSWRYNAFEIVKKENLSFVRNYNIVARASSRRYDSFKDRIIFNDEALSTRNKIILAEKKRDRELAITKVKNARYRDKIDNIPTVPFEKNGIKFHKHKLDYEGIVVDTRGLYGFQSFLRHTDIDAMVDFNSLFEGVMKAIAVSWSYHHHDTPWAISRNLNLTDLEDRKVLFETDEIKLKVGSINITLSKNTKDKGKFLYINKIRINKHEVGEVLSHAVCYKKQDDYEKFLRSVSSCSLKFHKAISDNIIKTFYEDYGEQQESYYGRSYRQQRNTTIELKIKRVKNTNYLILNDKPFRIGDTNKLIDFDPYNTDRFLTTIKEICPDIEDDDLPGVITEGHKRYLVALEKSKQLLQNSLKVVGAREVSNLGEGKGYIVTGTSGKEYFIKDKDGKVWELSDGEIKNNNYRCIVDRGNGEQMGKDRIVSRLYALRNDTMIADQVHTLKV